MIRQSRCLVLAVDGRQRADAGYGTSVKAVSIQQGAHDLR
jgi:hypothetical protein